MKNRIVLLVLAAALLAAVLPAAAQEDPAAPPRGQGQGQGQGRNARQNLRENLATLRLLQLTEALELTEAQTAKIYPVLTRVEKDKAKVQQGLGQDIRALRALTQDPAAKEAEVLALARSILDGRAKVRALDDEADQFLEKQLTGIQMGRYVIFQLDFYRGLENTVDQIRQRRGQGGPPPIKK
jgi:Spy/CpxP family protein refolding chaperone